LRLLALTLWLVFAIIYWGIAPWWTLAGPFALHVAAMSGFLLLTRAYRAGPEARPIESWRRSYILYSGLTGISYGLGGALLVMLPPAEPRLVVTTALLLCAALAPGRLYEPRSYIAFAGFSLSILAIGLAQAHDPLSWALAVGAVIYLAALVLQNRPHHRAQRNQVELTIANEDLAKRHQAAEADARLARDTLREAIENLPHSVVLWGADDKLVLCNLNYAKSLPDLPEATTPARISPMRSTPLLTGRRSRCGRTATRKPSSPARRTSIATAAWRNIPSAKAAGCAARPVAPPAAAPSPPSSTSPN